MEKVYLTFGLKPTMRKLENGLEVLKVFVLFSYKNEGAIAASII